MDTKICFNHAYYMKHDEKRTLISAYPTQEWQNCIEGWTRKVHPIYAMVLALVSDPIDKEVAEKRISNFFSIDLSIASDLLEKMMNQDNVFSLEFQGTKSTFPPQIIIKVSNQKTFRKYDVEDFVYNSIDLESERMYKSPFGIVWMVNNICSTLCEYCYADRHTKSKNLTLQELERFFDKVSEENIHDFTLSGGEFFKHPNWKEILTSLKRHNMLPNLISTKMPISSDDIKFLEKFQLTVQVSLDSCDNKLISKMWSVSSSYISSILETIKLLDKSTINYHIATVLTKSNTTQTNIEELHNFIESLNRLSRWDIRVAFRSLYSRKNFEELKLSLSDIDSIDKVISSIKKRSNKNINWSIESRKQYRSVDTGSSNFPGAKCSANSTHLFVLPDGNVTICEQLYWNNNFIIGNIKENSIADIWNGKAAKELAYPKQETISKNSVCNKCKIFSECYSHHNKCYADTIKAYGENNWEYPDPRCSFAPKFIKSLD
jgi:radical SAM protein with 4Fe4S-binding SPASM domain